MPAHTSGFASEPRHQRGIQGSIYNAPNGTAATSTAKDMHAPQIKKTCTTRHQAITPFHMKNMHLTPDGETATFVRPAHFLVRSSSTASKPGSIVPLIPLDLLPEFVEIVGVSRHLHPDMTVGMFNAGIFEKPGDFRYSLRFATRQNGSANTQARTEHAEHGPSRAQATPSSDVMKEFNDSSTVGSDQGFSSVNVKRINASKVFSTDEEVSHTSHNAASRDATSPRSRGNHRAAYPGSYIPETAHSAERYKSGNNKNQHENHNSQNQPGFDSSGIDNAKADGNSVIDSAAGTKGRSFCRHFCHHGTCKWGLACRYQHAMPMTLEGLQEQGLKDWPAWFRAEMRLAFERQAMAADCFGLGLPLGLSTRYVQSGGAAGNLNLGAAMATIVGQDRIHHRPLHVHYHPGDVSPALQVPVANDRSGGMIGPATVDKRVPGGSKPSSAGVKKKKEKDKGREEMGETGRAEKVKATKAVKAPTAQAGAGPGAEAVAFDADRGTLEQRKGAIQGEEEKEEEEKMMLVDI